MERDHEMSGIDGRSKDDFPGSVSWNRVRPLPYSVLQIGTDGPCSIQPT